MSTVIEVFGDVYCPFTPAGLRLRSWPLELVNGEPLDPGLVADEIDVLRRRVGPSAFAGFDRSRFPRTTLPALALAAAACERDLGRL